MPYHIGIITFVINDNKLQYITVYEIMHIKHREYRY